MQMKIIITDNKKFEIDESHLNHIPRIKDFYTRNTETFIVMDVITEANDEEFTTTVYVKPANHNPHVWLRLGGA
jgi:hypothetical protein